MVKTYNAPRTSPHGKTSALTLRQCIDQCPESLVVTRRILTRISHYDRDGLVQEETMMPRPKPLRAFTLCASTLQQVVALTCRRLGCDENLENLGSQGGDIPPERHLQTLLKALDLLANFVAVTADSDVSQAGPAGCAVLPVPDEKDSEQPEGAVPEMVHPATPNVANEITSPMPSDQIAPMCTLDDPMSHSSSRSAVASSSSSPSAQPAVSARAASPTPIAVQPVGQGEAFAGPGAVSDSMDCAPDMPLHAQRNGDVPFLPRDSMECSPPQSSMRPDSPQSRSSSSSPSSLAVMSAP
jgi:hypothetical protein